MIDWDGLLHAKIVSIFGEPGPIPYTVHGTGQTFNVEGVFDDGAQPLRLVMDPDFNTPGPLLGARLAQFPAGFEPRNAKGDVFVARGVTYVVSDGRADSHGWIYLEANSR